MSYRVAFPNGSSPRTRGTHGHAYGFGQAVRIIPAYAGNTTTRLATPARRPDHPRVRGEHIDRLDGEPIGAGSSPRTRGTHEGSGGRLATRRIIPAYAGNTCAAIAAGARPTDHPRVRGEHDEHAHGLDGEAGSSPRTRGTLLLESTVPKRYSRCQPSHRPFPARRRTRTRAQFSAAAAFPSARRSGHRRASIRGSTWPSREGSAQASFRQG